MPDEGIHVLNICITTLVNQCKFSAQCTKKKLRIMVLQHAVCYHEAWNWIHQQDQFQLAYQALLVQCQLLESCCEMFQKSKENDPTELTSLSTVNSSAFSLHQDSLLAYPTFCQCSYYQPPVTVQPIVRSATDVAVGTTSQPCSEEDPSNHPKEAEPSLPEMQAHHPSEDATLESVATAPLNAPPTGATGSLPTVLPTAIHTDSTIITMLDATGDPHPSKVTTRALG